MQKLQNTIRDILDGNQDAYALIVREYQDMLINFVSFRLPDRSLVLEIVHQTFIRAYEQLSQFDPQKDFGTWLRVICRYQIMTEVKRFVRERERRTSVQESLRDHLLETALGKELEESDHLARIALEHCVGELHESAHKLLALRYRQQKPARRIADQLGRTTTWVTTTLHRIRHQLRKCIETRLASEARS